MKKNGLYLNTRRPLLLWILPLLLLSSLQKALYASPVSDNRIFNLHSIETEKQNQSGERKKRFQALEMLLKKYKKAAPLEQLRAINQFYNQFQFISEKNYQGEEDYWKSPNEFIQDGIGDCEDFAIAKYFTALILGIPDESLRIIYAKSLSYNRAHMVLAYYAKGNPDPWVLDNLKAEIMPASQRPDLLPIYSFNGEKLWLAKQNKDQELGPSRDLNKWQQLIKRMQKGG